MKYSDDLLKKLVEKFPAQVHIIAQSAKDGEMTPVLRIIGESLEKEISPNGAMQLREIRDEIMRQL